MIKIKKPGYSDRSNARAGYKAACAKNPVLVLPHEVIDEDGRFFVRVATIDCDVAKAAEEAGLKVGGAVIGSEQAVDPVLTAAEKQAAADIEAAQAALKEIAANPDSLVTEDALQERLERLDHVEATEPTKAKKPAAPLPERSAPTWPVHKDYFTIQVDARREAMSILGANAKEKVDYVVCKLAIAESGGRRWFWVSMAQADAEWSNRKRLDAGLAAKPRSGKTTNGAPASPKTLRAPRRSGEENGCTWDEAEDYIPPTGGARKELYDACVAGKLPPEPDFSADTHARFRPKLAAIVAAVHAKDIAALKAIRINAITSSPKAMEKYRQLAVIALEAKAAAKSA